MLQEEQNRAANTNKAAGQGQQPMTQKRSSIKANRVQPNYQNQMSNSQSLNARHQP